MAAELADAELDARFSRLVAPSELRPLPDWADIHTELKAKRRTGVARQQLWHEYKERHPDGLQYSQFCEHYRRWRSRLGLVLRQEHRAANVESPTTSCQWSKGSCQVTSVARRR